MLANLYKKAGQERPSVTSYKEVLRQCPLALDAILGTQHSLLIFMECLLSILAVHLALFFKKLPMPHLWRVIQ